MNRTIPLIDMSHFTMGSLVEQQQFVGALGAAFQHIGFVGITGHAIPQALVQDFYTAAKDFFALPLEVKRKYEIPNLAGQRGYTAFGKEHAKGSKVADLKEFFQIGQTVLDGDPIQAKYPPNVTVAEIEAFADLGVQLYKAFEQTGRTLLQAIAIYLELDEHYFDAKTINGNSILRAIHYPPIVEEPLSAIRAEQHEDINLITLLVGASAGGLQIQNKAGEWLDIVPEEDEIVVNVGDMLQRLTNNYLKSTTHRVINPPKSAWHLPRLSIPFFLHPRMEMDLTCLEKFVTAANPLQYKPITAIEYLEERLREIGLKK